MKMMKDVLQTIQSFDRRQHWPLQLLCTRPVAHHIMNIIASIVALSPCTHGAVKSRRVAPLTLNRTYRQHIASSLLATTVGATSVASAGGCGAVETQIGYPVRVLTNTNAEGR